MADETETRLEQAIAELKAAGARARCAYLVRQPEGSCASLPTWI